MTSKYFNTLKTKSSIIFPSNVVQCSLTIKDFVFSNGVLDGTTLKTPDPSGGMNAVGWGVESIDYIGSQVFFIGWMEVLSFDGYNVSVANPYNSSLTILAIAQCE
ncbi:MAG: hypothetical protein JKY53_13340 [Flavobacteriales bacterium]|nr:hypothetical protein [Flavobacteriales bacterium]